MTCEETCEASEDGVSRLRSASIHATISDRNVDHSGTAKQLLMGCSSSDWTLSLVSYVDDLVVAFNARCHLLMTPAAHPIPSRNLFPPRTPRAAWVE